MAQIEKSVFISYRRTNSFHALAIFQALNNNGYDVFIDYASIDSGKFDDIILDQIKARAHFIPILTPSALERCDDPNDWVRIEIMTAIQYQRNIVPVMFDGFDWKQDIISKLPDVLKGLERFNALPVPSSLLYFQTAMELLHTKFLNKPVDVVIYPPARADVSLVTQKIEVATNQPAVTQDQLNADDYFERGNQYYQNWQYDRAIPEYTQSLHLNPNNPTAYYRRGVAYEEMGQFELANADYDQAIHQADKLIHNNPQDSEAYRARGSAYDNKREYDRAIADFDEAIRLNPKFDIAYNNRGLAYDNKREYDRAIADFDEAIRLNPNYALAYNNRGVVYANQREYDRAIADFDEAIRLNPQLALAYTNRGAFYTHTGEYDRAIANFDEAIRLNPYYGEAYNSRGVVYLNQNDYTRAIADFDQALSVNPNHEIARHNRERALLKKRDSETG